MTQAQIDRAHHESFRCAKCGHIVVGGELLGSHGAARKDDGSFGDCPNVGKPQSEWTR